MIDKKMNIKVVNENNEVVVKFSILNFELDTTNPSIKFTNNEEIETLKDGYTFSTHIKNFLYIINYHCIKVDNITFDKNSLDCYYTFTAYGQEYAPELNECFFEKWSDYDFPNLIKHRFNITKKANYSGEKKFIRELLLIENSFCRVYVDEEIKNEEIKSILQFLSKRHPMYQQLNSILDARVCTLNDLEIAYAYVKEYEAKVQEVIDLKIVQFCDKFNSEINKDYGFDCGFLLMFTNNEKYNKSKRLLINSPKKINDDLILSTEELEVEFPLFTQSTTLKVEMFEFLKPILEKEMNDSFYYKTILD